MGLCACGAGTGKRVDLCAIARTGEGVEPGIATVVVSNRCGDGFVEDEACDDGNDADGDGCDTTVLRQGVAMAFVRRGNLRRCNLIDGDECDSNCTPTACGNGVLTAGEGVMTATMDRDECRDGCTLNAAPRVTTVTIARRRRVRRDHLDLFSDNGGRQWRRRRIGISLACR